MNYFYMWLFLLAYLSSLIGKLLTNCKFVNKCSLVDLKFEH